MRKKILTLALALALSLAVSAPAYGAGKAGGNHIVSAGDDHTGFIDANSSLWMWGNNRYGHLGNGSTTGSSTPVKVLDNVAAVSCGGGHTAAVKTDGTLWMWGENDFGQLGNGSQGLVNSTPVKVLDNVAAVSCGTSHTAAVKTDGSLWTWGRNSDGSLGNGSLKSGFGVVNNIPVKVLDKVAAVSCGYSFTAAVKTDGTLWVWGDNRYGLLCNGTTESSGTPVKVLDNVAAVSCGWRCVAAVKTDGSLWMWGENSCGQLGNGGGNATDSRGKIIQTVPVKVLDNVAAVSCGNLHTAAVKTDGSLWMWGDNCSGELGNGRYQKSINDPVEYSSTPVKVLDNVTAVSCGTSHTAAVKRDGTLWTWGMNNTDDDDARLGYAGGNATKSYYLSLGGGSTLHTDTMQTVPKQVAGLTASVSSRPTTPVRPQRPSAETVASPTNDKLEVNGSAADPTVYKIGGSNYFKIRDVAALLNGTEKQFAVGYDGSKNAVTATTGQGYDKQSGDLAGAAKGGNQAAAASNDAIYVNGEKITAEVYKINGSNYFKLRDLGKALDFYVGWSRERGMYIETDKPYSE